MEFFYGRYDSFLGNNALSCVSKYNVNICDIVSGSNNANYAVKRRFIESVEDFQFHTVNFLRELVLLRDEDLVFSNDVYFNREELELIIRNICND